MNDQLFEDDKKYSAEQIADSVNFLTTFRIGGPKKPECNYACLKLLGPEISGRDANAFYNAFRKLSDDYAPAGSAVRELMESGILPTYGFGDDADLG